MEWSSILVTAIGIVAFMQPTSADVETTCTANGNECDGLKGEYCNTVGGKCACVDIYSVDGTACKARDCTDGGTVCSDADPNSACVSTACACKVTFELTGAADEKLCSAKVIGSSCTGGADCAAITNAVCESSKCATCPSNSFPNEAASACIAGVGTSCSVNGNECAELTGGYCNTDVTQAVCACADIFEAGSGSKCTAKDCTDGGTECSGVDPNSVCVSTACACKVTFELTGAADAKLCSAKVIDSSCTAAADCDDTSNAECASSKCSCPSRYFSNEAKTACIAGVGTTCTANGNECDGITGAVCDTSADPAVCACPDTHTPNEEGSQCTPKNIAVFPAVSVIPLFVCSLSTFLLQF